MRVTSAPMSSTVPASGCSKPAMTRSVVVLPEPEGPSSVKNSPRAMSRSRFSIATTSPNVRRIPRRRTAAAVAAGGSAAGSAGACVAKRLLQDREPAFELLVRRGERRQQPDDVSVEAAGEKDESALACSGRDRFRGLAGAFRELEREHRAEAAHLTHDRVAGRDLVEPRVQERGDLVCALAEPGRTELLENGERCCAGDGVTAERPAETARVRG